MNNNLQIFDFNKHNVRTFLDDKQEIWFCLKDVCDILGLTTPAKVVSRLDKDGVNTVHTIDVKGRKQNTNFIDEPNLYSVIFQSRKPVAKKFQKWVFKDVIPEIRKTGNYGVKQLSRLEIAEMLVEAEKEKLQLEAKIEKDKPKIEGYEQFLNADNYVKMLELAAVLNIGRNTLFKILRDEKILMTGNIPYRRYLEAGWFVVKEKTIEIHDQLQNVSVTLVTPKGMDKIRELLYLKGYKEQPLC